MVDVWIKVGLESLSVSTKKLTTSSSIIRGKILNTVRNHLIASHLIMTDHHSFVLTLSQHVHYQPACHQLSSESTQYRQTGLGQHTRSFHVLLCVLSIL